MKSACVSCEICKTGEVKHWMIVKFTGNPKHLAKANVCQDCFEEMCRITDGIVESVEPEVYKAAIQWWPNYN